MCIDFFRFVIQERPIALNKLTGPVSIHALLRASILAGSNSCMPPHTLGSCAVFDTNPLERVLGGLDKRGRFSLRPSDLFELLLSISQTAFAQTLPMTSLLSQALGFRCVL